MTPIQTPVTGSEQKGSLAEPVFALSEFYQAFNSRDMDAMSRNWAQTDEISMDNPLGGIKRGWPEIKAVYERIFSGPAKVYVEFHDYTIHETADLFYAVGRERGEFSSGTETIQLAIRTSRLFKCLAGTWKQVHHHGSIEDPDLLRRYQAAVAAVHNDMKNANIDLEYIRKNIDQLDSMIISLLAKRSDMVSAAATLKKDEQAVRDPRRVEQVIEKVRARAVGAGLDPEIAEKTYRTLINCFVQKEMSLFRRSE